MDKNLDTTGKMEWPAEDYAVGAFVQRTFADQFLKGFSIKSDDNLLDVGCGDGSYTLKLADRISHGTVVAIDFSENMISLAKQRTQMYNNVTFEHMDAAKINYKQKFSLVTALWSLQWVPEFEKALENIYHALQPGGRFFALYSIADSLGIRVYKMVKDSGKFPSLEKFNYHRRSIAYISTELGNKIGKDLGFKYFEIREQDQSIDLPGLDTFRKFIKGINPFQGQVPENEIPEIIEEMVKCFDQMCQKEFAGKYIFKERLVTINAIK